MTMDFRESIKMADADEWSDPRETDTGDTGFFTPPQQVPESSQPDGETPSSLIVIPALLQTLFGLDYLPLPDAITECVDRRPSRDDSYQQHFEDVELSMDEDASSDGPSSIYVVGEENERPSRPRLRGKRIKKAYAILKNKIIEAKRRRKQQKSTDDEILVDVGIAEPLNEEWFERQQLEVQRHKSGLFSMNTEAQKVQARVEELCSRIRASQAELVQLEIALARQRKELQKDTMALEEATKDLAALEKKYESSEQLIDATFGDIQTTMLVGSPERAAAKPFFPRTPKTRNRTTLPHTDPQPKRFAQYSGVIRRRGLTEDLHPVRSDALSISTHSLDQGLITRASSAPNLQKELQDLPSTFIRVHDLDLETKNVPPEVTDSNSDTSSLSQLGAWLSPPPDASREEWFNIDSDIGAVLDALIRFGYSVVTDESERFAPVQNTARLLEMTAGQDISPSWPIRPWHQACGNDILVWQGTAHHHGPGKHLPLIKARGIIPASPETLIDLLLDSSRVREYNKMSQGRTDLLYLQKGVHTTAAESAFNIAGEAKIMRSLNRPPVIRRNIEMISLTYARPLEVAGPCQSYVIVSRSVWEDGTGLPKSSNDTVRSEMHLGVNLLRPVESPNGGCFCELTTITHVQTSAVPELLAKRMAPSHAAGYIKEIQSIFN
jgi:hypothetical protein